MKITITILILFITTSIYGQYKRYQWPYIKEPTPRYLSIYTGLSDRSLNSFEIGVGLNIPHLSAGLKWTGDCDSIPPQNRSYLAAFVGPMATYRFNQRDKIQAFTLGLSIKSPISFGIDFAMYNKLNEYLYSVKPLIGIYLFHFNFEYGYNFYLNKTGFNLKNGDFRVGLNIPIIKLTKTNSNKNKI